MPLSAWLRDLRPAGGQVGVFLAYATPDGGRALVDRELYLPESWTGDRDRCEVAGIGGKVAFATKPELARRMIERAVKAGVPFAWLAADEVYGGNPKLRAWLEEQEIPYVMAVKCSELVTVPAGKRRAARPCVPRHHRPRLTPAGTTRPRPGERERPGRTR